MKQVLSFRAFRSLIIASLAWTVFLTPNANAATYVVTTANDSGTNSLRQAITSALADPDPSSVIDITGLPPFSTIVLLSPLPVLSKNMTINGPASAT